MADLANSTPEPSRRAVFGLAALPILASPAGVPAFADDAAMFHAWERQLESIYAAFDRRGVSDADTDRLAEQIHQVEHKIFSTPTTSADAMQVKLRMFERIATESMDDTLADGFAQARAFIAAVV